MGSKRAGLRLVFPVSHPHWKTDELHIDKNYISIKPTVSQRRNLPVPESQTVLRRFNLRILLFFWGSLCGCQDDASKGPEGVIQDQPRCPLASHRMEIKLEPSGGESRIYWRNRERTGADRVQEVFAWGLGFLLTIVVRYTCLLRHPGTGQNKDRIQVSVISHLFPTARRSGCQSVQWQWSGICTWWPDLVIP